MSKRHKSAEHKSQPLVTLSEEERREMIATNAYYRGLQRGFSSGHEEIDWLAAELEVNEILRRNILQ